MCFDSVANASAYSSFRVNPWLVFCFLAHPELRGWSWRGGLKLTPRMPCTKVKTLQFSFSFKVRNEKNTWFSDGVGFGGCVDWDGTGS
jgi:hypothetical protein